MLVSGGSASNLTAIACARETLAGAMSPELVGYVSDMSHSSIPRAARALGFRPEQLRVVPTGPDFRIDTEVLAALLDADVERGLRPLFVVANAGATSTGAIDPSPEVADVCARHGAWLHVDAAYGGFSVLTERGRSALLGIERADSVTLDPHKWLYQPWECGALLVREGHLLRQAFAIVPDYLRETAPGLEETSFGDMGLQLSRGPRALKVWLSIQCFGLGAFRRAIERSLDLAERVRERTVAYPCLEIVAPPSLSITCVRRRFPEATSVEHEDALNLALAAAVEQSGLGLVTTTVLDGRTAIRLCVLNHATGPEHVDAIVDLLATATVSPTAVAHGLASLENASLAWAAPPAVEGAGVDLELIRSVRQLADAPERSLRRIAALVVERAVAPEERIVEEGEQGTDFFFILEGNVEVSIGGDVVARLVSGDFFGELAALDWGAGFGYPRLATVTATTPVRLLVLPERTLSFAMRLVPRLDREVRARFAERRRTR